MTAPSTARPIGRAFAGALFAVVVWGGSFVATKVALRQVEPMTVIWLRFGIGVAVLALAVARRHDFFFPSVRELARFVGLGAIGITLHQLLQVIGLVTARASTTSWIITATPLTMALVGRIVLKERLRWRQIAGIAIGAAGVLLVVSRGDWSALTRGSFGSIGDLLVAMSTLTWTLFSVYSRQSLQRRAAAPMILYVVGSGWLLGTIPWVLSGGPSQIAQLTVSGWTAIAFLGVMCSGLAYVFWYDALKVLPTATVGSMLYLEPIVTMGVAAAVLGESITLWALLGGAVILAGVRAATAREA